MHRFLCWVAVCLAAFGFGIMVGAVLADLVAGLVVGGTVCLFGLVLGWRES